jgi:FlaG/FlaF family flagellin (archaellin)
VKAILREDKSGVSEVLGTILILGMTVTLFSVIIVWVSSVPAPIAQTRVDLAASMSATPTGGGVLMTLTHRGGEPLYPVPTVIYVTDVGASNLQTTDIVTLHLFSPRLANPSGLLDGTDSVWTIGERWEYENFQWNVSDSITITIVDTTKNTVEWNGQMNPSTGARPPIFLNVWAAGTLSDGQPNPVYNGNGFFLFAEVISPGDKILPGTVNATITANGGTGVCDLPMQMVDTGPPGPDIAAGDNIYSLGDNLCMNGPTYPKLSWAGTFVLLTAMDTKGRTSQTRFILNVLPNPTTIQNTQTIPSQLWQYIGFVQIRTGEVWLSNLTNPYSTTNTFQPFRVQKAWMNAGVIFHFKLANHGNTTIFMDGWTEAFFQNTQSSAGAAFFVTAPCSTLINANAGGVTNYPGNANLINDFEYAHSGLPAGCQSTTQPAVFDINPLNQETGGTPYVALINAKVPFGAPTGSQWQSATYFISLLVSGMAGPANYTYAMLTAQLGATNPYGCTGLGSTYNPINHLLDSNVKCRTQWYAQVIPFIGMVVF